jgi:hypothetical protein
MNQVKYNFLSQLAQSLSCIPATSAPSESAFTAAGLIIAKERQQANTCLLLVPGHPLVN